MPFASGRDAPIKEISRHEAPQGRLSERFEPGAEHGESERGRERKDDKYEIDLTKDDLFATVIDARIDVQDEAMNEATTPERKEFLAALENALKQLANSSSYGVLNEFIADDRLEEARGFGIAVTRRQALVALHFLAPLFTFIMRAFLGFAFLALACVLVLVAALAALL